MSWDVGIQRFSKRYTEVSQIAGDEPCMPLGSLSDVQKAISAVFTGTDWSDPAWGVYDSSEGSIEFNMGDDDPNTGFVLHVRASSKVVPMIISLCNQHGWQALDYSSGSFLEIAEKPTAGLEEWTKFRDQVLSGK